MRILHLGCSAVISQGSPLPPCGLQALGGSQDRADVSEPRRLCGPPARDFAPNTITPPPWLVALSDHQARPPYSPSLRVSEAGGPASSVGSGGGVPPPGPQASTETHASSSPREGKRASVSGANPRVIYLFIYLPSLTSIYFRLYHRLIRAAPRRKKSEIDLGPVSGGEWGAGCPWPREGGCFLISFPSAAAPGPLRSISGGPPLHPRPATSLLHHIRGGLHAASKAQRRSAIGNTHVLQSINLAVCSVGQAGRASWRNSCSGMPWVLECRRPRFESWAWP